MVSFPSPPSKPSTTTSVSNTSPHSTSVDHSANVILFGVPELPLPMTKSVIDEVALHLIGRPVSIKKIVWKWLLTPFTACTHRTWKGDGAAWK